jgi:hypothetical protein
MKPKPVDLRKIESLIAHGTWVRAQGLLAALPPGVNVPTLFHVTVSGSLEQPRHETKLGRSGDIVAAWDVFRHDPADAPFIFNTDHYFVVRSDGTGWLFGPYKTVDPGHWLHEIPTEFEDCELLMSASTR